MKGRQIQAPAKINLGLEILGKRDDGFHEIRTILAAIALFDDLRFEIAPDDQDEIVDQTMSLELPTSENLVVHTLQAMRQAGAHIPPQRVTITKRIPAAAGLGGASSDAASTLRAFEIELLDAQIDAYEIAKIIGSDVPFFLGASVALASGRGERLVPLPQPTNPPWVIIAVPELSIANKTAEMYKAVEPEWWSDGSAIDHAAEAFPDMPTGIPPNVFERALLRVRPEIRAFRDELVGCGFTYTALTGAGPAWYTLVETRERADEIAASLGDRGIEHNVARLRTTDA